MTRQDWMAPLTVRTANVLLDAGCLERDHVLSASDEWILRLRNAGRRVLDELRARGLRPDSCSSGGCQLPIGHGGDHVTFESRYAVQRPAPAPRLMPRIILGRAGARAELQVTLAGDDSDYPDGVLRPMVLELRVEEAGGPGRPEAARHEFAVRLSVAEAHLLVDELRLRLREHAC